MLIGATDRLFDGRCPTANRSAMRGMSRGGGSSATDGEETACSPLTVRLLSSLVVLFVMRSSFGQLRVQGLTVSDATPHELRPGRDCNIGFDLFVQGRPETRMMPAQLMA